MTLLKNSRSGQTREKKPVFQEFGINVRSYAAAEKGDEGMALKIRTRAEDMADGKGSLESHAHTKWKKAIKKNQWSIDDRFPFQVDLISEIV
jgi:hypothetical protein